MEEGRVTVAAHRFSNDLRYRDGDHPAQTQLTPAYILDKVRDTFAFKSLAWSIWLDPCTTPDNPTRAERFFTAEDDGLKMPWRSPVGSVWRQSVFVNPPYGKAREPWVRRCIEAGDSGQPVVLLIPAATDTRIFQSAAAEATAVVLIRGRVKFGVLRPNRRQVAASHPSALLCWNVNPAPLRDLGLIVERRA